jgi:hypothetical protein
MVIPGVLVAVAVTEVGMLVEVALADKAIPEGIVTAQSTPVVGVVQVQQAVMQVLAAAVLVVMG